MISMIQGPQRLVHLPPAELGRTHSYLYCKQCGAYHIDDSTIKAVADLFRKESSGWLVSPRGFGDPACRHQVP